MAEPFADDVIEEMLERLAKGEGLAKICRARRMPGRSTIYRWMQSDDDLAARILEAREIGFHIYAEETVALVERTSDPVKARVLLDARRWYLGKLSNAFADRPIAIGGLLNVDAGDAFAAVAGALESAASAIASRRTSTITVDAECASRSVDAGGQRLADLAGPGGTGLGEDPDGG